MNKERDLSRLLLSDLVKAIQDTEDLLGPDSESALILRRELIRRENLLEQIQETGTRNRKATSTDGEQRS